MPPNSELITPGGITAPPHQAPAAEKAWLDGEPQWLDASPARRPGKPSAPAPGEPPGRPLPGEGRKVPYPANGATLPTWTKFVAGLTGMGMLYSVDHWARPTLKASKMEQRRGTWGWLQRTLDSIQGFLDHGTNSIGHEVSKGAAHAAHGPAYTIGLGADRWNQLVWNVTYNQLSTEYAIGRIILRLMPHAISQQVRPVRVRVRKLRRGLLVITGDLNALRAWVHHDLNRNVKPRLGRVEHKVKHDIPTQLRKGQKVAARQGAKQKADHKLIIKLLPLLTVTGATAVVIKAFGRLGLSYLRCLNMKGFGNALCPSPPGSGRGFGRFGGQFGNLLGDLAALTFVPFLLTDACRLVGVIEGLAIRVQPAIDELVLGIEGFVCGGVTNLPSAIEGSDLKRAPSMPSGL